MLCSELQRTKVHTALTSHVVFAVFLSLYGTGVESRLALQITELDTLFSSTLSRDCVAETFTTCVCDRAHLGSSFDQDILKMY